MKYLKQLLFLEKEKLYQYFTIAQVFRSVQRINVVIFQLWMNYIASIG